MSLTEPPPKSFPVWMDELRSSSGVHRPMGLSAARTDRAHFHLLRKFKGEVDLLAILNTKRCVYNCSFCDLPTKSSADYISPSLIFAQVSEIARQYAGDEINSPLAELLAAQHGFVAREAGLSQTESLDQAIAELVRHSAPTTRATPKGGSSTAIVENLFTGIYLDTDCSKPSMVGLDRVELSTKWL